MNATTNPPDPDKQYDRAIILIQYYVQLMWVVLSAFLLAETVLLGAIAQVAKDGPDSFVFGGALLGLLLVIPWWASFRYNHALYSLRVYQARSLEPAVGTFFTTGGSLIDTGTTPVHAGIRIPWLARKFKPRHAVLFLILLFTGAFASIAITHRPSTWRRMDCTPTPNQAMQRTADRSAF